MANTIPCPNPVCTHQFGLAELQAAAQLLCPKCGFHMQGKGRAKPAAPPKPVAAPPKLAAPVSAAPMPPLATPVVASNPFAVGNPPAAPPISGEESIPDGAFFNPEIGAGAGAIVRTAGKPKRKFNWMKLLVTVLAFGFAASIVIAAITGVVILFLGRGDGAPFWSKSNERGSILYGQIRAKEGNERVYKLALPKEDWEIDKEMRSRFETEGSLVAAWKHKEYDFWFAVIVQDYGVLKPRDAEMLRIGIDKLENVFGDALEIEKKAEPAKMGDRAALKIDFRGQIKAVNWNGQCIMFFNNGIAYWLYIASPDKSVVEYFVDELPKKNFSIESERRGWREQAPPMKVFTSANRNFTVNVLEKVWDKASTNPKDIDEKGVLYLSGTYAKEKDNRKNASILVYTFENKGDLADAMKAAREARASKEKNDNENYKLELANDVTAGQTDQGAKADIGNRKGRMLDLKRLFNDEPQRYFLLAVVNEADTGYAILCDCSWDSRQIWRQDFLDVLRGFKFKKGE